MHQLNCRAKLKSWNPEPLIPPFIIVTSSLPLPLLFHAFVGGVVFSYLAAGVDLGRGDVDCWAVEIARLPRRSPRQE